MAKDAREVWAKRVERLADSGLSAKEFAAEIGVNANTLAGWRWRLRTGESAATMRHAPKIAVPLGIVSAPADGSEPGGSAEQGPIHAPVAPMKFIELTTAAPVASLPFEVVLRSGRTVRVPGGFDGGELARLVAVLEEARS